jgi:hypothetical protein
MTGGDVGSVEADGEAILCLWLPSLLVQEAGVYGNVDVRDDLQWVYWVRCGRDAEWEEWRWVKMRPFGKTWLCRRCE